jgi:hypothetical protein
MQIGRKLKKFHSNNGGEYKYLELNNFVMNTTFNINFPLHIHPNKMGLLNRKNVLEWNLFKVCSNQQSCPIIFGVR